MSCSTCNRIEEILQSLAATSGSNPDGTFADGEFAKLFLAKFAEAMQEEMLAMRDPTEIARYKLEEEFRQLLFRSTSPKGEQWLYYDGEEIAGFIELFMQSSIPDYSKVRRRRFLRVPQDTLSMVGYLHSEVYLEPSEVPDAGSWRENRARILASRLLALVDVINGKPTGWIKKRFTEWRRGLDIIAPVHEPPCGTPLHGSCANCHNPL